MKIRDGIELANLSDLGRERENNEDYFCYAEPEEEQLFVSKGRLAVVADGMGGEEGGATASRLAVDTVRQTYYSCSERDPQACLIQAFRAAQQVISEYAQENARLRAMGTTCSAVAIVAGSAHFAHIGDSRLYLVRNRSITKLTRDHTAVGRLIEEGVISPQEAGNHPQRHLLTSALTAQGEGRADFSPAPIPLEWNDLLVLCTDGLWAQISDSELLSVVQNNAPTAACRELIELARDRGGPDNLTVQILRMTESPLTAEPQFAGAVGSLQAVRIRAGSVSDPI
jgi:protein phosphatase